MALTVGTDTYITQADADAYFVARGNTGWSGATTTARDEALIKATQYLDAEYLGRWKGTVTDLSTPQLLSWPRQGVIDGEGRFIESTDYPAQLTNAQCELALKALDGDLYVDVDAGGQPIREKVGPLEIEYNQYAKEDITYTVVDRFLKGLLISTNRLIRA